MTHDHSTSARQKNAVALAVFLISIAFFIALGFVLADKLNWDYDDEICRSYSPETGECSDSATVSEIIEDWKND